MTSSALFIVAGLPFLVTLVLVARSATPIVRQYWVGAWAVLVASTLAQGAGTLTRGADAVTPSAAWWPHMLATLPSAGYLVFNVLLYAAVATVTTGAPPPQRVRRLLWLAAGGGVLLSLAATALDSAGVDGGRQPASLDRAVQGIVALTVAWLSARNLARAHAPPGGIALAVSGIALAGVRNLASVVLALGATPALALRAEQGPLPLVSLAALYLIGFGSLVTLLRYERETALERQRALQQDERWHSLGQMAAGIAHDFNNVLAVIRPNVELARAHVPAGHPQLELLADVEEAAERGRALVNQLTTFARGDEDHGGPTDAQAALAARQRILQQLLPVTARLVIAAAERGLRLAVSTPRFDQVVLNLVINARDAMPAGGTIRVGVTARRLTDARLVGDRLLAAGAWAVLEVSDDGTGIPPDVADRIFEPFFTTKEGGGTGLGLATVRSIAVDAGGSVELESAAGRGATFRCWFRAA